MYSKLLENDDLLRECVEVLHPTLLSPKESLKMYDVFRSLYPITPWGGIDWIKISQKIVIGDDPFCIMKCMKELLHDKSIDTDIFIAWGDAGTPVMQKVIVYFDYVACLSFEKFIFNPHIGYVIEILFNDSMTVGLVEPRCKEVV